MSNITNFTADASKKLFTVKPGRGTTQLFEGTILIVGNLDGGSFRLELSIDGGVTRVPLTGTGLLPQNFDQQGAFIARLPGTIRDNGVILEVYATLTGSSGDANVDIAEFIS